MKTKFSFLALPFLGLVLTIALAATACSGDKPNGPVDGKSSSSGGYVPPVSVITSNDARIDNFGLSDPNDNGIIKMHGSIIGIAEARIVKLEFMPSEWVSYTGPQPSPSNPLKVIDLSEAQIDLKNSAISCGGPYNVGVKACTDNKCDPPVQQGSTFVKPQEIYCRSSSSGGGSALSSSSSAGWKFGSEQNIDVAEDESTKIGSGAFRLEQTESDITISLTSSCNIRDLNGIAYLEDDPFPVAGKTYGARLFTIGSPLTQLKIENSVYYFIYCDSDKDKYLIWFLLKKIGGLQLNQWPKPVKYWQVTESP